MIRKAKIEEVEQAYKVIADAKLLFKSLGSTQWQDLDNYPSTETLKEDIINKYLYVKEVNNELVGIFALSKDLEIAYNEINEGQSLNNDEYYVIHRLAVKKEYYRTGLAKEMLKHAEELCLADGIYNLKVDTMENNYAMIKLLTHIGYKNCGVIYLLRDSVLDKKRIGFQKVLFR